MAADDDELLPALRDPGSLHTLPLARWDRLVRQARRVDLLARLASMLQTRGLLARVAPAPRAHLQAALIVEAAQQREVLREVAHVERALAPLGVQPILLKGAAYTLLDLPVSRGRLFSDVDLLVPQARLAEVELALMMQGWATTHHSAYDQRYYRQWMHELPPLRHAHRRTVLDVHHAILPRTARLKPSSAALIAAARPLPGRPGLATLAPEDMVLHSIAHLFHNDDLSRGLRDLSDIDLLLRDFAPRLPDFWRRLLARGAELDLRRPLHYGLRHAHRLLGTPVPADVLAQAEQAAPPRPLRWLMDGLWTAALGRAHRAAGGLPHEAGMFALYLRAHWLRMPPLLLVRHLTVKALKLHELKTA